MKARSEFAFGSVPVWARWFVRVPLFILLSVVAGLLPSFTLQANLYVLVTGAILVWLGASGRVDRLPPPARLSRGAWWWVVPTLALAVLELVTFAHGSTPDYPTLSVLADPAFESHLGRSGFYFVWLTAFWGLVRR